MEKLLSLWMDDANQKKKNIPVTQAAITEKAKSIFHNLKETDGGEETFSGSKGCLRFKSRSNCCSVKLCGETASADVAAAADFPKECQGYIEQGFKAAKARLTVLLGANVSGTLKLKPMLVYHSQTPHALNGLNKDMLPIYWKWNKKAWVTQDVFTDWYTTFMHDFEEVAHQENLIEDIIRLVCDVGLEDVTSHMSEAHDQLFSNEDLEELYKELDCE
ncbi:tigger transposable element-derived protein 1-like [Centruroides vittatus]|uniref:tigger transposable element-derived protein 1-like n=1 Tax=Centruroides vittatus TaxID=120091 RepID=UPI00350FCB1F